MKRKKNPTLIFAVTLVLLAALLAFSHVKTVLYNSREHSELFAGAGLFTSEEAPDRKIENVTQ